MSIRSWSSVGLSSELKILLIIVYLVCGNTMIVCTYLPGRVVLRELSCFILHVNHINNGISLLLAMGPYSISFLDVDGGTKHASPGCYYIKTQSRTMYVRWSKKSLKV